VRTFFNVDVQVDTSGHLISRELLPAVGIDS